MLAPPTTEMNLEVTVLREVSQSLKDTGWTPFVCAPFVWAEGGGKRGGGMEVPVLQGERSAGDRWPCWLHSSVDTLTAT